jgi:hypothetical protein
MLLPGDACPAISRNREKDPEWVEGSFDLIVRGLDLHRDLACDKGEIKMIQV